MKSESHGIPVTGVPGVEEPERHWPGQVVTLRCVAPEGGQGQLIPCALDPVGNDRRRPFASLEHLSQALEGSGDDLAAILGVLQGALAAAVSSSTGLHVTIATAGDPVTVTAVGDPATARASMLLPLHLIGDLPAPSAMVFYAAEPGAFTELAADTRATFGLDGHVEVDRHLPPPNLNNADSDITSDAAVQGRSAVDQAVGVLIDRGHPPEEARRELAARAAAAGVGELQVAADILHGVAGPGGSSDTALSKSPSPQLPRAATTRRAEE